MDLADYISFLTTNKKTELKYNFEVFPRMLERAVALIPYLQQVLSMDLEAMQNAIVGGIRLRPIILRI